LECDMFPTAGSTIDYNDAGEVLGWDGPSSYDLDGPDPDDWYEQEFNAGRNYDEYDGSCVCGAEDESDCTCD